MRRIAIAAALIAIGTAHADPPPPSIAAQLDSQVAAIARVRQ